METKVTITNIDEKTEQISKEIAIVLSKPNTAKSKFSELYEKMYDERIQYKKDMKIDIDLSKPFVLSHVALYAKGWYKRSADIWADIKKCLEADGWMPSTNQDVVRIIINNATDEICGKKKVSQFVMNVLGGIDPVGSYRYGYYHKQTPRLFQRVGEDYEEYSYEKAILMFYISCLRDLEKKDVNGYRKPSEDVLPFSNKDAKKKIEEFEWLED